MSLPGGCDGEAELLVRVWGGSYYTRPAGNLCWVLAHRAKLAALHIVVSARYPHASVLRKLDEALRI